MTALYWREAGVALHVTFTAERVKRACATKSSANSWRILSGLNHDLLEAVAAAFRMRLHIHGDLVTDWRTFDAKANGWRDIC